MKYFSQLCFALIITFLIVSSAYAFLLEDSEVSYESCSSKWSRMTGNLKNRANASCSNGVKSYGSMSKTQNRQGTRIYFCKIKTNITCN